jgi:hypothetical protein
MATSTVIPSLIPMGLAAMALYTLLYSFDNKTWPPPLISFILWASAGLTAMSTDFEVCEGIVCSDFQIITLPLTYVFGGLSLMALALCFLRVIEAWGDKNAEAL